MRPYSYNGHRIEQAPDRLHRCMKCCGAIGLDFHVDDKCTDAFLDLSPLQKFMGAVAKVTDVTEFLDWEYRRERAQMSGGTNLMYGMDYDFGWALTAPSPEPEKSPLDKALEDFVAKRRAKREGSAPGYGWAVNSAGAPDPSYHKDMYHLDRAMRRLGFHEQDIHTRLMPYRARR